MSFMMAGYHVDDDDNVNFDADDVVMMFASTVAIGFPCNPHWYSSSNQGQPEVMNDDQGDDDDGFGQLFCDFGLCVGAP